MSEVERDTVNALFIIAVTTAGCVLSAANCYRCVRQPHAEAHIRELRVVAYGWVGMVMALNAILIPIIILSGTNELFGFWLSVSTPTLYAYFACVLIGQVMQEVAPWLKSDPSDFSAMREVSHLVGVFSGLMCIEEGSLSLMAWIMAICASCAMSGLGTFSYMQKRKARQEN